MTGAPVRRGTAMAVSRRRAAISTMLGTSTSTVILAVQAIVLIPLYINAIGPRLYGAWLGSGDILVWLQAFDLGLPNLLIQRVGAAHGRGDRTTASEYFASAMIVMTGIAVAVGVAAVCASGYVPHAMGVSGGEAATLHRCFAVAAAGAALNLFTNGIVGFSRGIQETTFLNIVSTVAAIFGFAVSAVLVLSGAGLWAVSLGLVTRSVIVFAGALTFVAVHFRRGGLRSCRPRAQMLHELFAVLPVTAIGGVGYSMMTQSELFIVASCLRPELAVVLGVTRKLLEFARALIDTIAFASYGGIAHLVSSSDRHRILSAHAEVTTLRTTLAITGAATYMAINGSLVRLWVGEAQYGGPMLTILFALQFIAVGGAFLANYLYRALGPVVRGSLALAVESAIRVPLMIGLVLVIGLPGIPVAGILTGTAFALLTHRWTVAKVAAFAPLYPRTPRHVWVVRACILTAGAAAGLLVTWRSWPGVAAAGIVAAVLGGLVLLAIDPLLATIRYWLRACWTRSLSAALRKECP